MGQALSQEQEVEEKDVIERPETVGQILMAARLAKGKTLQEIAHLTKVRQVYLQALEENRPEDLPAQTYALGFVRSYCRALGLNADSLVVRYQQEIRAFVSPTLDFPEVLQENSMPQGKLIWGAGILGGVLIVVGLGLMRETVPPQPIQMPPPPPVSQEPMESLMTPLPSLETTMNAIVEAPPPPPSPVEVLPKTVSLKAVSPSWIRVVDGKGTVWMDKTLKPGETYEFPDQPGIKFSTGNAGGLELIVPGQDPALLGAVGEVRKSVPVEGLRLP